VLKNDGNNFRQYYQNNNLGFNLYKTTCKGSFSAVDDYAEQAYTQQTRQYSFYSNRGNYRASRSRSKKNQTTSDEAEVAAAGIGALVTVAAAAFAIRRRRRRLQLPASSDGMQNDGNDAGTAFEAMEGKA
jgi:hypothetical protein